jgi:sialate O-acetylesterase
MRYSFILILTFLLFSICYAKVKPNNIFSDNMVLLRDANVPVWGNAAEGEKVIIEFAG